MAFKTFSPGVLTSSDVNTFLMRQAVIVATSSTRPASPNEGMTVYETDTNVYKVYDGANWVDLANSASSDWLSYTPAISGTGWALGNGTILGGYQVVGKIVHFRVFIAWGSTSTFGTTPNFLRVSLPLTVNSGFNQPEFRFNSSATDASTGLGYVLHAFVASTTTVVLTTNANPYLGVDNLNPFTWVSLDRIAINGTYEAA